MRRHESRITDRRPELSQHFLRDTGVARALVRRIAFPPGAFVVEAGAGDGLLTEALADAGYRVLAVEKDERLFRLLRRRLAGRETVICRHGDFLALPMPLTPYRVASNVPYGITAAIVRKLLDAPRPPDEAALVVQREAAEKFAGAPFESRFSLLRKPWFEIRIDGVVPRHCFEPPPRVRSVLLRIQRRSAPLVASGSEPVYRRFIVETFGRGAPEVSRALRRYVTSRQLARLRHDLGFAPDAHASELSFSQWLAIFRFVEHECLGHDPTEVSHQVSGVSRPGPRIAASCSHAMRAITSSWPPTLRSAFGRSGVSGEIVTAGSSSGRLRVGGGSYGPASA